MAVPLREGKVINIRRFARILIGFVILALVVVACGGEQEELATAVSSPSPTPAEQSPVVSPTATPSPTPSPPVQGGLVLPNVSSIVEKVKPGVVAISVETLQVDFFLRPFPGEGAGTGIIVESDGFIVTNDHVIANARRVRVALTDGRSFPGVVVGRDPLSDLAVVKIEATGLSTLTIAPDPNLKVGDWVIAIGNALELEGGPTVTVGVVSTLGRQILTSQGVTLFDLIQTDAAINPGNSGGPLVNLNGKVVGINTAIASRGQGIGFSISSVNAGPIIGELMATGRVVRPQLGVQLRTINSDLARIHSLPVEEGAIITQVLPGTAAAKAGLRLGDIIVRLDEEEIDSRPKLQYLLWKLRVGDTVQLTILREGKEQSFTITLGERPPEV